MGLTVNYTENVKGLATEQFDALNAQYAHVHSLLSQSLANDALILSQLEKIMSKQTQLEEALTRVDESTTVMAEAQMNIAASLTNISDDIDRLVAGGVDGVKQETLDSLGAKAGSLREQAEALKQLAESAKTIANKVDEPVPVPPVVPPVVDPDTP